MKSEPSFEIATGVSTNILSKSNPAPRRGIKEYMHKDNSRKRLRFAFHKASFIHMQGLSSNLIFVKQVVAIMMVIMKESGDPTQKIQILSASGHPVHINIRHTRHHFQTKIQHALLTPKEFTPFPKLVKVTKPLLRYTGLHAHGRRSKPLLTYTGY
jgi:hypothetical protein